ncbi:MAG: guanylate kinase [Bacteroidales bacterium]|jgi:guanylate kinase|nr:guanylate kinase [Bacteroidales bacterium]
MKNGKLIIFAAPSGSGKTSIVKYLLEKKKSLKFSISATTRPKRDNENEGIDYFFLSIEQFQKKIAAGDFLEWEEVYEGVYYGTLRSEVDKLLKKGKHVLLDVDVLGALNIKKVYTEKALALFIKPPSIETLIERLINRGTESKESLERRINKATYELSFEPKFDITIINEHLKDAQKEAEQVVCNFIK